MKKPNILLITADQFRWDCMGFLEKQNVLTPNIDQLAKNSARHHNCFSVSPLCMSARCSLLTGLYPHQHGMMDNKGDLNPTLSTMPQALKKQGYATSIIGKIHFYESIPERLDLTKCYDELYKLGFDYSWVTSGKTMAEFATDEWTKHLASKGLLEHYRNDLKNREIAAPMCLPEEDGVDYLTKEVSIDYLNNYKKETPFFMWLSFCNPHPIFDSPKEYYNLYNHKDFDDKQRNIKQSYKGLITMLDKYIGEVIATLKATGQYENTLIIFTADHGEMLYDNDLSGKCYPNDGSAKVPFLAFWKDMIPKGNFYSPIELTDVCATLLKAGGCDSLQEELPESPSKSLFREWKGDSKTREYSISENGYQFHEPWRMIVNESYKYVYYPFSDKEYLYDRINDPFDTTNVSTLNPYIMKEMRKRLIRTLSITPPPSPAFWIGENITGVPSAKLHHGLQRCNYSLEN